MNKTLISAIRRLGDTIPSNKLDVLNPEASTSDRQRSASQREIQASIELMREAWTEFPSDERKALAEYMQVREGSPEYPEDDGAFSDAANWQLVVDLVSVRILEISKNTA